MAFNIWRVSKMGHNDKTKSTESSQTGGFSQNNTDENAKPGNTPVDNKAEVMVDLHNMPRGELTSPDKLIKASSSLNYDELLQRFESLLRLARELPTGETRHLAEGLLAGAEELLLRQDEIGTDFSIAIIALNEQANRQLLAVFTKND